MRLFLVALLPIAACAGSVGTRSAPPAPPGTSAYRVALREAAGEIVDSGGLRVAGFSLGAARVGTDTFAATLANATDLPLAIELDLRVHPGVWLRNLQLQQRFDLAPRETRPIAVAYGIPALTAEGALRVRFTQIEPAPGPGRRLFQKWYAVGGGNPDARDPLADLEVRHTAHLELYAPPATPAARDLARIGAERERALRRIARLLDVAPPARVRLVFFPDSATKTTATRHIGLGWALHAEALSPATLVEIYNDTVQLDPFHELAHIVAGRLGEPPALLNEGFATYVSERLGSRALDHLGHPGQTVDQAACALARERQLIPIDSLLRFTEIGSDESRPVVAYAQSASFVEFLIERHGLTAFRTAYRTLESTDDPSGQEANAAAFNRIFGTTPAAAEAAWRRLLPCGLAD